MVSRNLNRKNLLKVLNDFENENFDDLIFARLMGDFKNESFGLGFQCCIDCIKEYYKFPFSIDKHDILKYTNNVQ